MFVESPASNDFARTRNGQRNLLRKCHENARPNLRAVHVRRQWGVFSRGKVLKRVLFIDGGSWRAFVLQQRALNRSARLTHRGHPRCAIGYVCHEHPTFVVGLDDKPYAHTTRSPREREVIIEDVRLVARGSELIEFAAELGYVRARCDVGEEVLADDILCRPPRKLRFPFVVGFDDARTIKTNHAEGHRIELGRRRVVEVSGGDLFDV